MYRKCWRKEEIAAGLTPRHKTAIELKKIYESYHKELKFEMETAEDFESKTLPTLDFQCWIESGREYQDILSHTRIDTSLEKHKRGCSN